ncbi:F-box protein At5g07610-like [Apium graveolens]|uniref:F-box protein At5g07610-like n=1 Tax=Apium graveolens TaxID=4045 RepID=UPI003D7A9872
MEPARPNPTLLDDLITEILIRLPVKSVVQFQSVSKTWLSLIKHPAFVKAQLRHALTTQTHHTLVTPIVERYTRIKIFLLHVESRQILSEFKFPFSRGEVAFKVVGSANGIIFGAAIPSGSCKISWYLWNPAIRQSMLIPPYTCSGSCTLGFAYDPIDQDFKIVCVDVSSLSAEVYSANRNVWRKLPHPVSVPLGGYKVCVNGFLFGINGEYNMLTFDLNKEVMNCAIKLPVVVAPDNDPDDPDNIDEPYEAQAQARIIEFNNSIAVIVLWSNALNGDTTKRRLEKIVKMWKLDDDACLRDGGVEASWTLMFSIDLGVRARLINGYFSKGDLLLLISNINYDYMWISGNAYKKEAKIVPIPVEMAGHHNNSNVYEYTESLAGFKQVSWNVGG